MSEHLGGCTDGLCSWPGSAWRRLTASWQAPLTGRCMSTQARLWQVGKLMPQKLAKHMEVSTFQLVAGSETKTFHGYVARTANH